MVLMPCGRCCCEAGAPFELLGNPTSIEVDLSQGTSHNYSVAGNVDPSSYYGSSFSGTAGLPSFSGTYSLSLTATNHWEYEDSKVWIAFDRVAGLSPSQSLVVVPKVSLTGSHTIYLGTTTSSAAGGTGASVSRDCSSTFANRYGSTAYNRILIGGAWYPSATSEIVSGDGYGARFGNLGSGSNVSGTWYWQGHYAEKPRVGAYAADLRLPFTVTSRAGIMLQRSWDNAYTQTANTFPFVSTPTPIALNDRYALYSFEYVFSIDAVRLIYALLTVDHFDAAFPTATGFSYT